MLVAREVIDAARDRHPAFDRNRNPDKLVLRFLSSYATELHGKVVKLNETALLTELSVALPLADHEAGIPLPPHRYVAEIVARLNSSTTDDPQVMPVALIPWAHRFDRNRPIWAGWVVKGTLYLRSPASRWQTMNEIAVSLVPTPILSQTLDDPVALPDEAGRALIEHTAAFMARRGHSNPALPAIDLSACVLAATSAEEAYLADVANGVTSVNFQTRDVWP